MEEALDKRLCRAMVGVLRVQRNKENDELLSVGDIGSVVSRWWYHKGQLWRGDVVCVWLLISR